MIRYHNAYLAYIHGRKSQAKNLEMRFVLKELLKANQKLIKESLSVRAKKIETQKDLYKGQRQVVGDITRITKKKNDVDTSGSDS
jgi:hypothetical protein